MIYHKCDRKECGKEYISTLSVELRGYKPASRGGILIPNSFTSLEFCSKGCFIQFMLAALKEEGYRLNDH